MTAVLDLRGTPCPINYVKTKLALEELEESERLEVWLDGGEPIENVPRSARDDGYKIVELGRADGYYRVIIERPGR